MAKYTTGEVYPHVCGAAVGRMARARSTEGLSPRVWGSRFAAVRIPAVLRSIPTCVGQPYATVADWVHREVYPHVCGAANSQNVRPSSGDGLSPRVWGSQAFCFFCG